MSEGSNITIAGSHEVEMVGGEMHSGLKEEVVCSLILDSLAGSVVHAGGFRCRIVIDIEL